MDYIIPLFDLDFDEAEERAVLDTIRSKWISTGPKTNEFESKFAAMIDAKFAIAVSNCTVALHLALMLANINANDEVICPSLTFVATANSIRYVNATPVFADIMSFDNLSIDPSDIESKITDKTKAIIVMHYGGFACEMDQIISIANKYNLKVIEDACHGPLSEYKGRRLGTIGDFGCFSFFSNKNISTAEGGMLIIKDKGLIERAKLLRSHGMTTQSYQRAKGHAFSYDVVEVGYNYRMDDIRASIGIAQLDKLRSDLIKRNEIRKWYIEKLSNFDEIILPYENYSYFSSNYIFPIILKNSNAKKRNWVRSKLADAGIQTSVHYPAVHRFTIYKDYFCKLPNTNYVSDNLITLPMFSKLTKIEIEFITTKLAEIFNEKSNNISWSLS